MDLGATVLTVEVPDRGGQLEDVALGLDTAEPYLNQDAKYGAVIGRFANRIAGGRFAVDGKTYQLALNAGPNSIHGGVVGFDRRVWAGSRVDAEEGPGVRFALVSPDGEEGFPGEVNVSVTYIWTEDNSLIVDYEATSSAPTPFNVTQHTYWNLAGTGAGAGSIEDHLLQINAAHFVPVDEALIPLGSLEDVSGTPFDFRTAKPIGRDIAAPHEQLRIGGGYDHSWVLDGDGLRGAAVLTDPKSGRTLTVSTSEPAIQVYTGNYLNEAVAKAGKTYAPRDGVALEAQHLPDSPNQPAFPDTILRPGETFRSRTVFAFSTAP